MIARKIFSSSIWIKDPLYLKVWIWIIGEARYEEAVMKEIQCERKEFVTTYNDIIKAASCYRNRAHVVPTLKQVRTILEWFEGQGMILVEPIGEKSNFLTGADPRAYPRGRTGAYTGIKITVLNYIRYQNPEAYRGRPQSRNKGIPSVQQGQTISNKDNKEKKNIYSGFALEVLSYLNTKTSAKYRNAKEIEARLREGGTVEECRRVIDTKLRDPYFIENPKYLNPVTLFRKSHWDKYLNEASIRAERPKTKWD